MSRMYPNGGISRRQLTEPQRRLLLALADNNGIGVIDGHQTRPLEALIDYGFALQHGSVAGKLTPAGEAEAARLKAGG